MDGFLQRLKQLARQYKYVFLVVFTGILLMLLPSGKEKSQSTEQTVEVSQTGLDTRLEEILGQIQGVGKVRVMLTVSRGEQVLYVYDEDGDYAQDSESSRREAVIITDKDRAQGGLISQVIGPQYQGAVIVCQGGDQPAIRLQVVEAVCDLTGLTADKVTVLKMK